MRRIIRIGVLVVPWLMAVALPILFLPGFAESNTGIVDPVHLLGFEFVLIPLAPLMLLRCLLANPACSLGLKLQTNFDFTVANHFVNGWTNSPALLSEVEEPQLPFRPASRHDKGHASASDILQYVSPQAHQAGEMT